jgi:hypothetical protein
LVIFAITSHGINNGLESSAHHERNGHIHDTAAIDKQFEFVDNAKLF